MLGRRGFLQYIGAAVLGAALALKAPIESAIDTAFSDGIATPWALSVGDCFSIEGVYAINPITYARTNRHQLFVATQAVEAGEFIDEDSVWPKLVTEGTYQTVSQQPAPGAKVGLMVAPGVTKWRVEG